MSTHHDSIYSIQSPVMLQPRESVLAGVQAASWIQHAGGEPSCAPQVIVLALHSHSHSSDD